MIDNHYRKFVDREMRQYDPKTVDILVKWTHESHWEPYRVSVPYDKTFQQVIAELPIVDWKRKDENTD